MIGLNLFLDIFGTPYTPCMELHNRLKFYCTVEHPSISLEDGANNFFSSNNFLILQTENNISDKKITINDILNHLEDKILSIYTPCRIYFPNYKYYDLKEGDIFFYNPDKLKIRIKTT